MFRGNHHMTDGDEQLIGITDQSIAKLMEKHQARESALRLSREVIRGSANAIRAIQRNELSTAATMIETVGRLVSESRELLQYHQDIYFAGFTQDAQKEYAEASCVYAFIAGTDLPKADLIGVEIPAYLNGLAEAASELRRYILDSLRKNDDSRCEELMQKMDATYNGMITIDFPEAITSGLRRTTDQLRAVLERTRGDLTMALRQKRLELLLAKFTDAVSL
jgi:translin